MPAAGLARLSPDQPSDVVGRRSYPVTNGPVRPFLQWIRSETPQYGRLLETKQESRVDFETVFDELYPGLFRYCHRLTGDADVADDITQEAFVRLYERQVEGTEERVRAWLFRTAIHLVRDRHRLRKNRARLLEANPVSPTGAELPDRAVERGEDVERVRAALDELKDRDRGMLLLRYEGFSYREIAEAFDVAAESPLEMFIP